MFFAAKRVRGFDCPEEGREVRREEGREADELAQV
jgi:hypothetical protein